MEDKFKFFIKELYYFIVENLPKEDSFGNYLGDWKIVNQKLKDGDFQIVIYRKNTELNFMFSEANQNKIELMARVNKKNDSLLYDSFISFFELDQINSNLNETMYFKDIKEFQVFVYKFLLKSL